MPKAPPVPEEQRAQHDPRGDEARSAHRDSRDQRTDVQSPDPGDADVRTHQQGRYGNIKQNTSHQGNQQDR